VEDSLWIINDWNETVIEKGGSRAPCIIVKLSVVEVVKVVGK